MNKLTRRSLSLAALLTLAAAGGCNLAASSIHVVDVDNGYKAVPGATVARYLTPKRAQPWPTTPTEVKQADAEGVAQFDDGRGRYVVSAPGKGSASFYAGLPPKKIEIGLGAPKPQR
ncbi:hypothetical protein EON77_02515 [bacterium]|nr:MAG: hypothetical protein EON77_02515 [bacterium]